MSTTAEKTIQDMFTVGAHYAFSKSRRNASAKSYIFGQKDSVEIFDLEKTEAELIKATDFVKKLAKEGKTLLFIGTKNEARDAIKAAGELTGSPFVFEKWKGGSMTNFDEIKKRLAKLENLISDRDNGRLAKYTKKEQLLIGKDIASLQVSFGGLRGMKKTPDAVFVVDPGKEEVATAEARQLGIPVIALASSDCNFNEIDFPIPANDNNKGSVSFFTQKIAEAYKSGLVTE